MKKRIFCAILTLIMLISLVPAGAVTVSAAANAASGDAITVLKTLEVYTKTCNGTASGVIGYDVPCTGDHSKGAVHTTNETEADKALREEVKKLDTAVNNFASKNGLTLSQGQHDALVIFSYDNGTAWMSGTGTYKSAVVSGVKGNEFLNAAIDFRANDNDNRRMIEANMYLNGQYNSTVPASYKKISFDCQDGSYAGKEEFDYYFDVSKSLTIQETPVRDGYTFRGWYTSAGEWVTTLNSNVADGTKLFANWQSSTAEPATVAVNYKMNVSQFTTLEARSRAKDDEKGNGKILTAGTVVQINKDYMDKNGAKWCLVDGYGWYKVGKAQVSATSGASIDVTVTVTNSYVRSRKENNIYSGQNGTYYQGEKLRIINVADSKYDTFTWGQVAQSATDNTAIGWVALIYTDYDTVINKQENQVNNSTVVAKATVTVNGYVNVRNGAGLNNDIVGALAQNTTVDLYETKFINGHEWGRCANGWFCLDYAKVTRLVADTTSTTDSNVVSYALAFTPSAELTTYKSADGVASEYKIPANYKDVVISNLMNGSSAIWGKAYWMADTDNDGKTDTLRTGWIQLSAIGSFTAKFSVACDALTVRDGAGSAQSRGDSLSKGTEIRITEYKLIGNTVWGKTYDINGQYKGWSELSAGNVVRLEAPAIPNAPATPGATISGKIATVINTDSVNLREHSAATYKKIGTLAGGVTVAVWEEDNGWYKIDSNQNGVYDYEGDGWASGRYLNVRDGEVSVGGNGTTTGTTSSETGLGIVSNTYTGVNVRSNPGTGSALLGKILAGTTVNIYETTTHGTSKWGRTDEGWVCMDYIQMIGDLPADILAGLVGGTGSSSTITGSTPAIYTGVATQKINIRKSTSLDAEIIHTIEKDSPVTIHELLVVEEKTAAPSSTEDNKGGSTVTTTKTSYWARLNDGYLYAPGDHVTLEALNEVTYTLTAEDTLAVCNAAGGTAIKDLNLKKGDQATITDLKIVGSNVWGKAELANMKEGWVNLSKMTKGALTLSQIPSDKVEDNTTNNNTNNGPTLGSTGNTGNAGTNGFVGNAGGYRYTGKVIRTNSLNVRATASQTATKTTTLSSGQALVIYETTISEGMAWGRCDAGWVYLYYVDLAPVNNAVDAKVVYTEGALAYTDANCSEVAGTYSRMAVVDIYEVVGKMAKTDLGWVHTDNLG